MKSTSIGEKMTNKEKLILKLNEIGAVKFGDFVLKSGKHSPYYLDLRFLASYPKALIMVADEYGEVLKTLKHDLIVGVPYTGIPIATALALRLNEPMLFTRKEVKEHGTGRQIEGVYKKGQKAVVIDDVISDGASKIETIKPLKKEGLKVEDIIVLLDRGQGGPEIMKLKGYRCHSIMSIYDVITILQKHRKITTSQVKKAQEFLAAIEVK